MKKRIISMVLMLCIMLTMLPASVFADDSGNSGMGVSSTNNTVGSSNTTLKTLPMLLGTSLDVASVTTSGGVVTTYTDFITAFNFAKKQNNSTLKLLGDASTVYIEGDDRSFSPSAYMPMTIDLNGFTLAFDGHGLSVGLYSSLTINDSSSTGTGKITSTVTETIVNSGGNLTINGGSFKSSGATAIATFSTGVTVIKGGTFSGCYSTGYYSIYCGTGTVNDILADGYCYYDESGNIFAPKTDAKSIAQNVTVGEKPTVASVTTSGGAVTKYADFITAFNFANQTANSGSTLTLLKDTSVGENSLLDITNKITIDLNGYTLNLDNHILRTNAVTADLTINDNSGTGKITSTDAIIYNFGGKLTINGGSFNSDNSIAINTDNASAVTIINGGTFSGIRSFVFMNGKATLYGGTYRRSSSTVTSIIVNNGTVNDLLPDGCCYYDESGNIFALTASQTYFEQTVTVGEIDWAKAVAYNESSKTYTVYSANGLRWISGISNGTVTADTYKNDPAMPIAANFSGYTVKLANDIDLAGKNWVPINEISGIFNGAGHKVTNMAVSASDGSKLTNVAFIGYLRGTVKNLALSGSVSYTGSSATVSVFVGGVVGYMHGYSNIYNCVTDVDVSATSANNNGIGVAGIAGYADSYSAIKNCICTGDVTASGVNMFINELVGYCQSVTIENCYTNNTDKALVNNDEDSSLPIVSSIGTFDSNGVLTAAKGCVYNYDGEMSVITSDCTLGYGTTLKQAMQGWIYQHPADAESYVAWTSDTIPTLSTNYVAVYNFGAWAKQGDGYIRTETNYGIVQTAQACVTSGSTVTPYVTLQEAITAAANINNSTVKLLSNITTKQTVQVSSGTFAIDLNGKTWVANLPVNCNALLLDGTSNVTLKDSGTNGTFTSNAYDTDHGYKGTIYAQSGFNIEGGIYDNTNYNSSLYVNGVQAGVNITGGTLKNNVTFESCTNIKLAGGIYEYIKNATGTIGELLAEGYGYHIINDSPDYNDWVDVLDNDNVTNTAVHILPVKIITQPQDVTVDYATTAKLTVVAQRAEGIDESNEIGYCWFYVDDDGMHNLPGNSDQAIYDLPTNLAAGTYQYFCEVYCKDYGAKTNIITITVNKAKGFIANKNYPTTFIYNTMPIANPLVEQLNFNVPTANLVFTWYKGSSTDEIISNTPTDVGIYTLKITATGNDNVTAAEYTMPVEIKYLQTDVVATKSPNKEWYNLNDFNSNIFIELPADNNYEFYYINYSNKKYIVNDNLKDNGNIVDGERVFKYQIFQNGNLASGLTDYKSIIFNVDATSPIIDESNVSYSQHHSFLGWLFSSNKIDVTVPVSDNLSGANHISYVLTPDGGTAQAPKTASVIGGNATFTVNKSFKGEIEVTAYDKAGNACVAININKMFIEDTKPTLTVTDGTNAFTSNWYTTAQILHINAADAESGIKSITYTIDGGIVNTLYEAKGTDSNLTQALNDLKIYQLYEGIHKYDITVTDNALNSTAVSVTIKQDTSAPLIGNIIYSESRSFLGWLFNNSKIDVTVPVNDNGSGGDYISYVITPYGGTAQAPQTASVGTNGTATITIEKTFKGYIEIIAYDKVGHSCGIHTTSRMSIEDTKPILTVNDGTNEFTSNWYTTAQTLHISAADADSGIFLIKYTVDGGVAKTLFEDYDHGTNNDIALSKDGLTITADEGEHTYALTAIDNAGNTSEKTLTIKLDKTAPVISAVECNPINASRLYNGYKLTISATDVGGSNIAGYTIDGGATWQASNEFSLLTSTNITATNIKVKDNANNITAYNGSNIAITVPKITSYIELATDKANINYGDSFNLTASITTDTGVAQVLDGTVSFYLGSDATGKLLAKNVAITNGKASCNIDKSIYTNAGAKSFFASYSGSESFEPNSKVINNVVVSQVELTIKAADISCYSGNKLPKPAIEYIGFIQGENETNVFVINTVKVAHSVANTDVAGKYPITLSSDAVSPNYKITKQNGVLTVYVKAADAVEVAPTTEPVADKPSVIIPPNSIPNGVGLSNIRLIINEPSEQDKAAIDKAVQEKLKEVPQGQILQYDISLIDTANGNAVVQPHDYIKIALPYPNGTNKSYIFSITHLVGGITPEIIPYINTDNGIEFSVKSLSPFVIGYALNSGSDSNDDTTVQNVWDMVENEIAKSKSGDVIKVDVASYIETIPVEVIQAIKGKNAVLTISWNGEDIVVNGNDVKDIESNRVFYKLKALAELYKQIETTSTENSTEQSKNKTYVNPKTGKEFNIGCPTVIVNSYRDVENLPENSVNANVTEDGLMKTNSSASNSNAFIVIILAVAAGILCALLFFRKRNLKAIK